MGKLTPIMVMECVPGDKFDISCESLIRFAPLVSPVMHRMDVTMHYFFVPNRILWDQWENFITGNNLVDGVEPSPPILYLNQTTDPIKSLSNYLGLPVPTNVGTEFPVSALPFAAYQCIYNEYYRDQNLIDPVDYKLVNGGNDANAHLRAMRYRAWEHDYFTSALPFAQKGPSLDIPLGEVTLKEDWSSGDTTPKFREGDGSVNDGLLVSTGSGDPDNAWINVQGDLNPVAYDPAGSLEVTPTTINDLRTSFRLQEWLERNARAGTRYVENILAHFGVRSSDKRMQRPEYITGTKSPVVISEVLNTTGETLPQGNMAGHGVSVTSGKYGHYFCEEHGYIMGIMSIMPKTAYQQGVPRHFSKFDRMDYFWPAFAHLGEQEILNKEIFASGVPTDGVFGYTPRYSEYKYMPSRVAGDFQDSLDFWHLARIFDEQPALNQEFIECKPSQRIFAVEDPNEDYLYCHVLNKVSAVRRMPKFGTPMF